MASNVEPAEADAIRDLMQVSEEDVQERDFSRPRRFSAANLSEVAEGLRTVMVSAADSLAKALGSHHGLQLQSVEEVSADDALEGLEDPLAGLRLDVAGQPAWILWETAAAIRTVERSLGSSAEGKAEARTLTPLEQSIVEILLGTVVSHLGAALGLELGAGKFLKSASEAGGWRDGGEGASPHRIALAMTFDGPGGASQIRALLPVEQRSEEGTGGEPRALPLPDHLDAIEIDVRVQLGAALVQLDQLLDLEVGDVIPLNVELGDLARVTVDGVTFAHGAIGVSRGRVAVEIQRFEQELKTEESTT